MTKMDCRIGVFFGKMRKHKKVVTSTASKFVVKNCKEEFFILVEHLMQVLGSVGVVQDDPKISDILGRRPLKNWT